MAMDPYVRRLTAVEPSPLSARAVEREFRSLLHNGRNLVVEGLAKHDPGRLLSRGFTPKAKVSLFDVDLYLTRPRQNPDLRFFVAYVAPRSGSRASRRSVYARILYKDISLVWRAGSHLFLDGDEMWVGKGDTRIDRRGGWEFEESNEATTDLPFELQTALERLNRARNVRQEFAVLAEVLHPAPRSRIRAYRSFTEPRRRALERNGAIHDGHKVVWFDAPGDPRSLKVARGYQPDWRLGPIETYAHGSKLYGGQVTRYRYLSRNREVQHLFFAAPRHTWMIPPQATTTELSSFCVRLIEPNLDEEAFVPGFEYHFDDEAGPGGEATLHSQIPDGYVGELSPLDDSRADASAWLDRLPLLRRFRRHIASL